MLSFVTERVLNFANIVVLSDHALKCLKILGFDQVLCQDSPELIFGLCIMFNYYLILWIRFMIIAYCIVDDLQWVERSKQHEVCGHAQRVHVKLHHNQW